MKKSTHKTDIFRKGVFSLVFVYFGFYTVRNHNYIPSPSELNEIHRKIWEEVKLPVSELRTGDLILRHGKGFVSDAMLSFSTNDPQYSHSGIVEIENGKAYVYHAVGGEENETNYTRREPIEVFCHPYSIHKFGIFRYNIEPEVIDEFVAQMKRYYQMKVEFDLDFDMYTDSKMYCSEMIYKAMGIATKGKNFIKMAYVMDKPYVAIDDLYLNEFCNPIFSYSYD
jgi:hypothetical protein